MHGYRIPPPPIPEILQTAPTPALYLSPDRRQIALFDRQLLPPIREVAQPELGLGGVRRDKGIDFVGGARGTAELEKAVSSGKAAVAFSLHPVSVGDLMTIADAGGIMPPKSTWFEPKLRDGLLSHVI